MRFNTTSSIRLITPDVAVADGETRQGMLPAGFRAAIAKRQGVDWQIVSFRSIAPAVGLVAAISPK